MQNLGGQISCITGDVQVAYVVSRACSGIKVIEINIERNGTKKSAGVSDRECSFTHKNIVIADY